MPVIEEYIDKKFYFNQLFERMTIAIETKDYYNYPNKEYETIFVDVYANLKEKKGEVEVTATNLYIELHSKVERGAFHSELVPQIIDYELNEVILTYPGEALFEDEWNVKFEEALLKAVKENITSYVGLNSSNKEKSHAFRFRDIWIVE